MAWVFAHTLTVESRSYFNRFHQQAFVEGGYQGESLEKAAYAHAAMGYNFVVDSVGVTATIEATVSIDVKVTQTGVAPFYYPLSLSLSCGGLQTPLILGGVEKLIDRGESKVFTFVNVPATPQCLNQVQFRLDSTYAHAGRLIKFAQGTNGKVVLNIPMPVIQEPLRVNFTLIETDDGASSSIANGGTIDLANVGPNLSIQAKVNRDVTTGVHFHFNNNAIVVQKEPFVLDGVNADGTIRPAQYLSSIGMKTVSAVIRNEAGEVLLNETMSFRVIDTSSPLTAVPTPSPTLQPTTRVRTTAPVVATRSPTTLLPTVSPTLAPALVTSNTSAPVVEVVPIDDSDKSNMTELHGYNTDKTPPQLDLTEKSSKLDTRTIAIITLGSLMLLSLIAGIACCLVLRTKRRKDFGNACDESVKDDQATTANSSSASPSSFNSSFVRSQSSRTFFDDDDNVPKPAFTFNVRPAVTRQQSLGTVYDDDKTVASITYNGPRTKKRLKNVKRVSKEDKAKIDQMLKGNESYV
jgi:hypothetical protein